MQRLERGRKALLLALLVDGHEDGSSELCTDLPEHAAGLEGRRQDGRKGAILGLACEGHGDNVSAQWGPPGKDVRKLEERPLVV